VLGICSVDVEDPVQSLMSLHADEPSAARERRAAPVRRLSAKR
jgi:hypothetical protein